MGMGRYGTRANHPTQLRPAVTSLFFNNLQKYQWIPLQSRRIPRIRPVNMSNTLKIKQLYGQKNPRNFLDIAKPIS